MRIAILGAGGVGFALSRALHAAGHQVSLGSRAPRLRDGLPVPVLHHLEAARDADLVVNATPGSVSLETLTALGDAWLDGKVLLDLANAATDEGALLYPNASLAEHLQRAFPRAMVVKALSTFNTSVMTSPGILPQATTAYIAGDDADAKRAVAELVVDVGWSGDRILDLGDLAAARAIEHYYPLFLATYRALQTLVFNVAVVTEDGRGAPRA